METMDKRSKKNPKAQTKLKEFVVVTIVDEIEQAKEYESLLKVNDIPALVKEQLDPSTNIKGIVVMVPEDCLDEAHVVIESQDAYDDFYDFGMEEEEAADDFDSDIFNDEER
jgi:hypothetical protein